jgi:hypothetical protein
VGRIDRTDGRFVLAEQILFEHRRQKIGRGFDDIDQILAGIRLGDGALRDLARLSAPHLGVDEGKVFPEGLDVTGRIFDPGVGVPDHLAFFFSAFDELLISLGGSEFFERSPDLFGRRGDGGETRAS